MSLFQRLLGLAEDIAISALVGDTSTAAYALIKLIR
jgi:hypothetical protein